MKLRRLTISNIASIREAEIDFSAEPLAGSPVFLISGVTGAGKSTILDAICLALYANTPRLKNLSKSGHLRENVTVEESKAMGFTDVRNMVRRDAAEGSVELTFTGNDGVDYAATWSASRPRKKIGRALMAPERSLTFIERGKEVALTKSTEINARILDAVGLDFDKFCRTAMLAQGDFTRFLHAKSEEKSEILEKITGTDVYKRIGAGIRENYKERKDAVTTAQALVDGIKSLTDEELAESQSRLAGLKSTEKELRDSIGRTTAALNWLTADKGLRERLSALLSKYQLAMEADCSDANKARQQLVSSYEATAEPRGRFADVRNATKNIAAARKRLEELQNVYLDLYAGVMYATGSLEKLCRQQSELSRLIGKKEPFERIYSQSPAIIEKINTLIKLRETAQSLQKSTEKLQKELDGNYVPALLKINEQIAARHSAFEQLRGDTARSQNALDALAPEELRRSKEKCLQIRGEIEKAEILRRLSDEVRQLRSELTADNQALEKLNGQIDIARAEYDATKARYEREREAVDELIRKLRRELTVGCQCPLCRQTVAELPVEQKIQSVLEESEKAFRSAEIKLQQHIDKCNELKAKIEVGKLRLKSAEAQLPEQIIQPELSAEEVAERLKQLDGKLADCNKLTIEITSLRQKSDKAFSELESLRAKAADAQKSVDATATAIETSKALFSSTASDIETLELSIVEAVAGYNVSLNPLSSPKEFIEALSTDAASYKRAMTTFRQLETEIAERETANSRDLVAIGSLEMWKGPAPDYVKEQSDLDSRIINLVADVRSAQESIARDEKTIATAQAEIESYLKSSGMPETTFEILCTTSPEEIAKAKSDVEQCARTLLEAKTAYSGVQTEYATHVSAKPENMENEDAEYLKLLLESLNERFAETNREIGGIHQVLASDENTRAEKARLVKILHEKQAEAEKWHQLDALFGDADGKKFSTIAQSYVLMELIDSANKYMLSLTDRYRLKVEPNSFVISVEDAYDGFKARPTNTISGGESFIVSLALALALSDIADGLEVDTLFIDEGFGTLSGEALRDAIVTLQQLHTKTGRHVGIISHVEELREQIPVQIQVERNSRTSVSTVKVISKTGF